MRDPNNQGDVAAFIAVDRVIRPALGEVPMHDFRLSKTICIPDLLAPPPAR
jgi:hypothetical protein